ncbi:MAG: hypothetical protein IT285_02450 [Bdellovibrionales bacterium]|nr:hypothetical protein [Bdellovibrionales bacterium]
MRTLAAIAAFSLLSSASSYAAEDPICPGPPLLETHWEQWSPPDEPGVALPLGEWRLPAAWNRPDLLTEAVIQAWAEVSPKAPDGVRVRVRFAFPSANPFGIPFTFQRLELSWHSEEGRHATVLDWSNECGDPGRSMFPRQSFEALMELPSRGAWPLSAPRLRVWGSQN